QQRPQGQYQRGQQRPQGQYQRGQQRPQGQYQQGQQRPQGQYQQGQQRPQGQYQQGQQRPQGQYQQGQQRPQGQYQQGQQRPQGQYQQGQRRPQGQYQQGQQRPQQQTNQMHNQSSQKHRQQSSASNTPNTSNRTNDRNQYNNHSRSQDRNRRNNQTNANRRNSSHHGRQAPTPKIESPTPKIIQIGESITVKELALKLGREVSEVIKKLMMLGIMASINQEVDFDTATILAGEFGTTVEELPPEEDPTEIPEIEDDPATLVPRPPVVTVMGHVDHGKTSLLDVIRKTHVTSQEAGGITQHIGAYQVISQGKKIAFLDTPGHEAFTAMRARGAQVTDVAILVVAADDGVMPQTIEAINHAKSANVPIIVAINKIDRPGANPDRVKQQLSEHGLIPEDWGGDTITVPVSAHQKTGISDLLDMIVLVAEMQELKANPNRNAYGTIIEAKLDKGRGPVATVLVQKGTLHIGDSIIAGTAYGKVRAMINDRGEKVKKAEPSTPVEVLGLADVPEAGDVLVAVEEKIARAVAEKRIAKKRTDELAHSQKVSLDDLFKQIQEGNIKDLNIVIKADLQGSVEALRQALLALNTNNKEVRVTVVHAGVGAINESDVMLASAANALIIGFNVRPDANARKAAETEKIDIRSYRVIYEAINDVEAAMTGMLAPQYKEVIQGRAEIRQVFTINKNVVAGAYVLEGKVTSTSKVRVIRDGVVVHEGEIESLRRFKDDVKEVASGYEFGLTIEKFRDIKEQDIVEVYAMEQIKPNS
ncbi:MAG: translation initiation factor IF-2, partial [Negativicutes bacterium]